jgi:hypothetical protein
VSEWMLISVKDGGLVFHNLGCIRTINNNKSPPRNSMEIQKQDQDNMNLETLI